MERLNPLNDYLFLKVMGEEGDEEQLLAFLNAVLEDSAGGQSGQRPIRLVAILENRIITPEILGNKGSILDTKALTDEGVKIEVEVQLKDLHNMEKRTLLLWAREFVEKMSAGDDYIELPKVITINIVDFDNIKLDRFHTSFHIREDRDRDYILTDVLEIHFLNMVKFRKMKDKDIRNDALCQWLAWFDVTTPGETLEEVIKMNGAIGKAEERYDFVIQDKEFLRNYHRRQMELSDLTTMRNTALEKGLAEGRSQGLAEGRSEGRNEEKISVARNALAKGMSVEDIRDLTGLKDEEIILLQKGK